jgi:hypothetical protein
MIWILIALLIRISSLIWIAPDWSDPDSLDNLDCPNDPDRHDNPDCKCKF